MFEWLAKEIDDVGTRKFFLLDEIKPDAIKSLRRKAGGLPKSYHQFLSTFGNARLYREFDGYVLGVYPLFKEETSEDVLLYCFGHFDSGSACFRSSDIQEDNEAPVFELDSSGNPTKVAPNFCVWLQQRCNDAKKRYSKKEWEKILTGPKPFSNRETIIIEARRLYQWELVERTPHDKFRISIRNNSDIILPFLSVGLRHTKNNFQGGLWLPVGDIGPGETGEVEVEPYLSLAPADEQELFPLPDPEPEDRDRYWEFKRK